MALRKPETASQPAFEPDDIPEFEGAATMPEVEPVAATMLEVEPVAANEATVEPSAVVAAPKRVVAAPAAPKRTLAMSALEWAIDRDAVENLSLAATRIKGEQGQFFIGEKTLGSKIKMDLVSWNRRLAIGTGEQVNNDETKAAFRVSYDGATISGEPDTTVKAYIDALKAEGYSKARAVPYGDLWGFVVWAERGGDIAQDEQELVCLQASQVSLGQWELFLATQSIFAARGAGNGDTTTFEATAEVKSKGTSKYTSFKFRPAK